MVVTKKKKKKKRGVENEVGNGRGERKEKRLRGQVARTQNKMGD